MKSVQKRSHHNNRWLARIGETLQLDQTLTAALLSRVWQAISGPITIAIVVVFLSLGEQGVYYALVPVVAIQAFFDLGLSNLLITHFARQSGGLLVPFDRPTKLFESPTPVLLDTLGEEERERRIAIIGSIYAGARQWFAVASIGFTVAALVVGLRSFQDVAPGIDWKLPLVTLVLAATWSVWLIPEMAALEGLGLRDKIYRARLFQMIIGSIAVWVTLWAGGGLWAIVVAALVQAFITALMVWTHQPILALVQTHRNSLKATDTDQSRFSWRQDVLPGHWRLGLVGLAQHIATQFFALIILSYHGEEASAPLGMGLTMFVPIQMLAAAWLQTKLAQVSSLHGEGKRDTAGELWRRSTLASLFIMLAALAGLIGFTTCLVWWQPTWNDRFLTTGQMSLLSIGFLANHICISQGLYVIARFSRPLFWAGFIGFVAIGVLVWGGGRTSGVDGLLWGYAIGAVAVQLPLHLISYWLVRRA